ncbi:MAG: tRNA threonylcarbamoyladenosine dehydratase [Treponema sp.]|jgi:tRNA A37 threonylcarbamoyladenosine dehydratase|nr:tRNA threonylcarbamoyladenosine dehydratase [Treponema sp.]
MNNQFIRTETVLGKDALEQLKSAKVAIFGIGGVGSYAAEALARSGAGSFILVDHDVVALSNINRQIIALHSTVGQKKIDVMKQRILDINPEAHVETLPIFYTEEDFPHLLDDSISAVVDAIDSVPSKVDLIIAAQHRGIPIISSMGTGNKCDPSMLEIADIYKTSMCPLARIMRQELKKRNVKSLPVVYSKEEPVRNYIQQGDDEAADGEDAVPHRKRLAPGSTAFVPPTAGLIMASWVVRTLTKTLS